MRRFTGVEGLSQWSGCLSWCPGHFLVRHAWRMPLGGASEADQG